MGQLEFTGMIPPLISPLTRQLELDKDALSRMVDHVIKHRVNAIFLLGSTGEWASLSPAFRGELMREGVKAVRGRIPVLANLTANSLEEVRHNAEKAVLSGAAAGVLALPFYYRMEQTEAGRFLEQAADRSPLPLLLYNAPQYTGASLAPETIGRLITHEKIIGIKDSSGDLHYMESIRQAISGTETFLLAGPDQILPDALQMGFDGGVCGGSNLFPGLYTAFIQAFREGNQAATADFQQMIGRIDREIFQVSDSSLGFVIGLKYAMSLRGLCGDTMAMPVYGELKPEQKKSIQRLVEELTESGY